VAPQIFPTGIGISVAAQRFILAALEFPQTHHINGSLVEPGRQRLDDVNLFDVAITLESNRENHLPRDTSHSFFDRIGRIGIVPVKRRPFPSTPPMSDTGRGIPLEHRTQFPRSL
jgi:hypothetical protein